MNSYHENNKHDDINSVISDDISDILGVSRLNFMKFKQVFSTPTHINSLSLLYIIFMAHKYIAGTSMCSVPFQRPLLRKP